MILPFAAGSHFDNEGKSLAHRYSAWRFFRDCGMLGYWAYLELISRDPLDRNCLVIGADEAELAGEGLRTTGQLAYIKLI